MDKNMALISRMVRLVADAIKWVPYQYKSCPKPRGYKKGVGIERLFDAAVLELLTTLV
jgi:hypothetical protein